MKRSFRTVSAMVAATMTVSLFAACGNTEKPTATSDSTSPLTTAASSASESTKPAEKIKFRASSFFTGGDTWTTPWQEAIKDYVAANPNVEIVDDSTPAASDAFKKTKINTDFASGNEPAVAYAFTGEIGKPMVTSGKLITWEDELSKDTEWSKNFRKEALDFVKYDGKQYALPYIGFWQGMYYNKDIFDANNIKVPTNWNELLAAVDALNKLKITPIACSFAEEPHYLIETFILGMGGKEGHDKPFDASWAPALDKIKELYEKNAFSKDALTIKQTACQQLMKDKKAAMFISGSWSAAALEGEKDLKVMPVNPLLDGKAEPSSTIWGFSSGWYVTDKGNKDSNGEAVKFVKWITSPERAGKFFKSGGVPAISCQIEGATPLFNAGIKMLNDAKVVTGPVGDRMSQQAFTHIWKNLPYVMTGKKTSTQLLEEAQKLVK